MKTLMTLFLAVMACHFSFAQTDKQTRVEPPGKTHPLDHADSLAMIEAGVLAAPLSRADDHPMIDSLSMTDSLARVDSILHSRTKVRPFPEVIQAVLTDFPFNLRNITGELVLAQGEFVNYASLVQLNEAERSTLPRYHSAADTNGSCQ